MRGETATATAICDEGRATVTTMGELQRRQQWASYSDREASIGVWFGFAVLVQRLCIGIFFFFFFLLINTVYCFWYILLLLRKL